MSREKQIDTPTNTPTQNQFTNSELVEMKNEVCICCSKLMDCHEYLKGICGFMKMIEMLYAIGYRKQSDKFLVKENGDIEPLNKQSEGEWIDQNNGKYSNPIYVCSQCRKGTLLRPHINELDNMEMVQALSPFCPNCGAKMKGGAE